METDRHYFLEGLFIIGLSIAAAFCAVWLGKTGRRDDVLYRIHFSESVSGLTVGDAVKYQGVDVGSVRTMTLDPEDPRRVEVDVSLRKEAPVKTDTKATLRMKGITGVVFVELTGGKPEAASLLASTPAGQVPEIPSEKSVLSAIFDKLPKVIDKFSSAGDQAKNVLTDVQALTNKVKEDPSLLLHSPKKKSEKKGKSGGWFPGFGSSR